jgi:hypothetical protein
MYIFLFVVSCLYSTIIASEEAWESVGGIFQLATHETDNNFVTSMLCVDGDGKDTFKLMTRNRSILIAVASAINSSQKSVHISAWEPLEGELTSHILEKSSQYFRLKEWLGKIHGDTVKQMYILLPATASKKTSAWRQKKDAKAKLWESEMKKIIPNSEVFPYAEDKNGIDNVEITLVSHSVIVAFKHDIDRLEDPRWQDKIPFVQQEAQ